MVLQLLDDSVYNAELVMVEEYPETENLSECFSRIYCSVKLLCN